MKKQFSEIVEINPKVELQKNDLYPCVMMEDVTPGRKYVHAQSEREYKGGSRFEDRDTLFARITPCLENGKIAQYRGENGKPAFGSTEFLVFRAIEGVSEPDYIFYLSSTGTIRGPAEKSMQGASGRQRADVASVEKLLIDVPDLHTQRRIASILSAYDDLIENNTRRIKILEEMARLIYREWFVEFRAPGVRLRKATPEEKKVTGKDQFPEGWEVKKLGDVIELCYGKALKAEERSGGAFPVYGSSGVVGYHDEYLVKGPGIIVGRKGNVGSIFWSNEDFYPIDTAYYLKTDLSLYYAFFNLHSQNFINNDAAVPGLNRNQAHSLPLIIPSQKILNKYDNIMISIFETKTNLVSANANLRQTRDLLLPKLISGE